MRVKVTGITAANLSTGYKVTVAKGDESLDITSYSAMKYASLVVSAYGELTS